MNKSRKSAKLKGRHILCNKIGSMCLWINILNRAGQTIVPWDQRQIENRACFAKIFFFPYFAIIYCCANKRYLGFYFFMIWYIFGFNFAFLIIYILKATKPKNWNHKLFKLIWSLMAVSPFLQVILFEPWIFMHLFCAIQTEQFTPIKQYYLS